MLQSSTATVLGVRSGEREEGAEEPRKAPRKELCSAESCRLSRSLFMGSIPRRGNKRYISTEVGERRVQGLQILEYHCGSWPMVGSW